MHIIYFNARQKVYMTQTKNALGFLAQEPKKMISQIKWRRQDIDFLIANYLEFLPLIKAELRGRKLRVNKCGGWLHNIAEDIRLHCGHCIHHPDCQDQCLPVHNAYLDGFCEMCDSGDKDNCRLWAKNFLKSAVQGKGGAGATIRPFLYYLGWITFRDPDIHKRFPRLPRIAFILRGVHDRLSDDPDYPFPKLRDLLIDFTRPWGGFPHAEDIPDRFIHEAALTIIAFNYVFFADLAQKTLFLASRDSPVNPPDHDKLITVEGVDLGPFGLSGSSYAKGTIKFNKETVVDLAGKISALYQSDLLPEIDLNDVDPKYKKELAKYVKSDVLRTDNLKIAPGFIGYHDLLLPEYLQYMLYHNLLVLVQAARMTRFKSRIPLIFQDDNLKRLYNKVLDLRAERKAEERRNARRKNKKRICMLPPVTLSEACRALKIGYKSTYAALEKYRHKHPRHDEISKAYSPTNKSKGRYGLIVRYLSESKSKEIETWKGKVALGT